MAVAKRQGREKPAKIEQRKVWGPEWGPQGEQTAFLASPVYIGQAQGEEKTWKEEPEGRDSVSSLRVFWVGLLSRLRDVFPFYFLNKTEL